MNKILITICARGGSKGIPGKNIKKVGDRPLLDYTASIALRYATESGADVVLSTDSDEILEVGRRSGLPTDYRRPARLADDVCGKPEAIRDAMLWSEAQSGTIYDMVIDLDVTSPIRTLGDIRRCVEILEADPDALTLFSVNPCSRNPYFNMVQEGTDGYYNVVLGGRYTTRQSAPKVYDMNASIYVYRREALMAEPPRAVTSRSLVYVMDHICFDLDEPADYDYLAFLVETRRINL